MPWRSATLFLAITFPTRAADPAVGSLTGHYELAKKSNSPLSFDVLQKGKSATTSFSAGNADGSGAAPDGDGEGTLNSKGELLYSQKGGEFEAMRRMDSSAVTRFLVQWKPPDNA